MPNICNAKSKKLRIIERDGETCWICHRFVAPKKRSLDHVIPRSKGGSSGLDNLRLAHKQCNARRGNADPPITFWERLCLQKRDEP